MAERDSVKSENEKLKVLIKKKLLEIKETAAKHEAEVKLLGKRLETGVSSSTEGMLPHSGLSPVEKKELFDALELLKSEN